MPEPSSTYSQLSSTKRQIVDHFASTERNLVMCALMLHHLQTGQLPTTVELLTRVQEFADLTSQHIREGLWQHLRNTASSLDPTSNQEQP